MKIFAILLEIPTHLATLREMGFLYQSLLRYHHVPDGVQLAGIAEKEVSGVRISFPSRLIIMFSSYNRRTSTL